MQIHNSIKMLLALIAAILLAPVVSSAAKPAKTTGVPADYKGKPYGKEPIAVPGTIKATEYDVAPDGANDITFHYKSGGKAGSVRTTKDCIGLAGFDKSHVTIKGEPEKTEQTYLGWTEGGEWTKYTLNVKEAGTYLVGGHFAAGSKGGKVSLTFSNGAATGPLEIPTTAGYQPGREVYHVWEQLDNLAEIKLDAGETVMTFKIEVPGGFNIESITLTKKP